MMGWNPLQVYLLDEEEKMKKKFVGKFFRKLMIVAAVTALTAGCLAGCGQGNAGTGTESGQESQSQAQGQESQNAGTVEAVERILLKDVDLSQYVKLGDYMNLRVSKSEVEVSDEELNSAMQEEYVNRFPDEEGVLDKAVEVGDTANIDFEGKKDGVAFDGGTSQGYPLTIGSHSFIDGFEEGLIGVAPGETVDLNLKFPDTYGNSELAGQEVVFTVKVNYVIPAEIDEAVVAKLGIENVSNLEEFRKYIYDSIYEKKFSDSEVDYENEIFNAFMSQCEFQTMPADLVESTKGVIRQALAASAGQYGIDADAFVYYVYGTDLETFVNYYAEPSLKQNMALYLVAKAENIIPTDEEITKVIQEYMQESGYEDMESYLNAVGSSMDAFREDYSVTKAYDLILEIAKQ